MKKDSVPAHLKANSSLESNAFHMFQNETPTSFNTQEIKII